MKILATALVASVVTMPMALPAADVHSSRSGLAAAQWEQALDSGTYLHATYSPPRRLTHFADNHKRAVFAVGESLMPLPEAKRAWR